MNTATCGPIPLLRRAACGTLAAALLSGGAWAAAVPAAAVDRVQDEPLETEPDAVGGPWQSNLPHVYGSWPSGPPGTWASPVARARVSAPYGIPGNWKAGHHTGIDLAVPIGTTVRSVGSGKVVAAGTRGAYGKRVAIRMKDGNYTLFAHLSKIYVDKGERVKAGTVVGKSGDTGRTTGPHLHFEVRSKRGYGSDINPVAYLAQHGIHIL